jgi:heme-degrading monooxygenase HmoA
MFAVLFEVEPKTERRDEYLKLAAFLKPALEKIDGFIDIERFVSAHDKDKVLSLSLWRDEKSVVRWRTLGVHHEVQAKGRSEIFRDYHLRVGEITADTNLPAGETPVQFRFDETEIGTAKFVTISEIQPAPESNPPGGDILEALGVPDLGTPGLVGQEMFESIYNPGKSLLLASWRDASAAGTWKPGIVAGMRHRQVRIIRDYGMFDRGEAPQYYPPARAGDGSHEMKS